MVIRTILKILLITSLSSCAHTTGVIKIWQLDPYVGLVRKNGRDVIPLDEVKCLVDVSDESERVTCPYAAISWADLETIIESTN